MTERAASEIGVMPMVSDKDHRQGRSYEALWARWRGAEHKPLRVTARLAAPYVPPPGGHLHLDGILSAGLVSSHLVGASVAGSMDRDYATPLPLMLAWTGPGKRPLWVATEMVPSGLSAPAAGYIHKRHPVEHAPLATRLTVNTSAGAYKDVRMPLALVLTDAVEAWCMGSADDLHAILSEVSHVGRKGAIGYGRVLRWTVEPADVGIAWIMERRSVPLAALWADEPIAAGRLAPRESWTPPYWDARHHAPCRRAAWTP